MFQILWGWLANDHKPESFARMDVQITDGPHAGHRAIIRTAKYICGSYEMNIECSCGSTWENSMSGCWQHGHHRKGGGDPELKRIADRLGEMIREGWYLKEP